jgi:enoyl-CoA hydratase/carnithine racemase
MNHNKFIDDTMPRADLPGRLRPLKPRALNPDEKRDFALEHTPLSEYRDRFAHVAIRREEGIIELRLHTDGGPLMWGDGPHSELGACFDLVGQDRENRVVIITGTGDRFMTRIDSSWVGQMTPAKWDRIYYNGKRLLANLLNIEVPVIAAVNGPARVHAEIAVLSDITLASETAEFQDAPHFRLGNVPGDGVHLVWEALLGPNRGRYFLLTGEKLSAEKALALGVVNEVLPPQLLQNRAWELAKDLSKQTDTTLRYARVALTQNLRKMVLDGLGYGLALEGLNAYGAKWAE